MQNFFLFANTIVQGQVLMAQQLSSGFPSQSIVRWENLAYWQSWARNNTPAATGPCFQAIQFFKFFYCKMYLSVMTMPFRDRGLNIIRISACHWRSITLSRCCCREAKKCRVPSSRQNTGFVTKVARSQRDSSPIPQNEFAFDFWVKIRFKHAFLLLFFSLNHAMHNS